MLLSKGTPQCTSVYISRDIIFNIFKYNIILNEIIILLLNK